MNEEHVVIWWAVAASMIVIGTVAWLWTSEDKPDYTPQPTPTHVYETPSTYDILQCERDERDAIQGQIDELNNQLRNVHRDCSGVTN